MPLSATQAPRVPVVQSTEKSADRATHKTLVNDLVSLAVERGERGIRDVIRLARNLDESDEPIDCLVKISSQRGSLSVIDGLVERYGVDINERIDNESPKADLTDAIVQAHPDRACGLLKNATQKKRLERVEALAEKSRGKTRTSWTHPEPVLSSKPDVNRKISALIEAGRQLEKKNADVRESASRYEKECRRWLGDNFCRGLARRELAHDREMVGRWEKLVERTLIDLKENHDVGKDEVCRLVKGREALEPVFLTELEGPRASRLSVAPVIPYETDFTTLYEQEYASLAEQRDAERQGRSVHGHRI